MRTALSPARFPWYDHSRYTYSLGVEVDGTAYLSGHTASRFDPELDHMVVAGDLREQCDVVYEKALAILEGGGYGIPDVTHVAEFLPGSAIDMYELARAAREELFGTGPEVTTACVDGLLRKGALIEIELTAVNGGGARAGYGRDGFLHLPSLVPGNPRHRTLRDQMDEVYGVAERALASLGTDWSSVAKITEYVRADVLEWRALAEVRRARLRGHRPAGSTVAMRRLRSPDALIQLDVVASAAPVEELDPGWPFWAEAGRSPAVRAGDALLLSGLWSADLGSGELLHAGDLVAQAEQALANVLEVLGTVTDGRPTIARTTEYIVETARGRYRDTAPVRKRLLEKPYPAAAGLVCSAAGHPGAAVQVDCVAVSSA